MTHYEVWVRAHADRGGPCAVGVLVTEGNNSKELRALLLETKSVHDATLRGIMLALSSLERPDATVTIYANTEAIVGVCSGSFAGVCSGSFAASSGVVAVDAIRSELARRGNTTIEHMPNAAQHPCMERAFEIARRANVARGKPPPGDWLSRATRR